MNETGAQVSRPVILPGCRDLVDERSKLFGFPVDRKYLASVLALEEFRGPLPECGPVTERIGDDHGALRHQEFFDKLRLRQAVASLDTRIGGIFQEFLSPANRPRLDSRLRVDVPLASPTSRQRSKVKSLGSLGRDAWARRREITVVGGSAFLLFRRSNQSQPLSD